MAGVEIALAVLQPRPGQQQLADLQAVGHKAAPVALDEADLTDRGGRLLLRDRASRMIPTEAMRPDRDGT